MKLKSFTIIEVLIATAIFVCVVALSAASYGMVIKTDKASSEENASLECLSILNDAMSAQLKQASTDPFIWGVKKTNTRFEFNRINDVFPNKEKVEGVIIFNKAGMSMIFKSGDGIYSMPLNQRDFEKGYIDSELVGRSTTNILPPKCVNKTDLYISKSHSNNSFLASLNGEIYKESSVSLPVDISISFGEGI